MKKYVLTNEFGDTGTGVKIKAGKYVHNAEQHTALLSRLTCCAETAELAVLLSPVVPINVCLFQVHSWNVSVGDPNLAQNYTVIKEIPKVPRVTLELRMIFALRVLKEIVIHPEFNAWADGWIDKSDRGLAKIQEVRKLLEGEQEANEGLEAFAAWGSSSSDDLNAVHKMEAGMQRITHILRAAEHAEQGSSQAEAMAAEMALAMAGIVGEANKQELQALAAQILNTELGNSEPESNAADGTILPDSSAH